MIRLDRLQNLPLLQCSTHRIMNRVKDTDRPLITQITLWSIISANWQLFCTNAHQKHIDRSLLPFVLEIVDICPRHTLRCITQNTCIVNKWYVNLDPTYFALNSHLPARVRFPLLVKLVLSAPVPAYILLNASPFSAHSSRWNVQRLLEWIHSRRTRRRYCSKVWRERRSWMKFVRSRLVYRMLWAINR